MKKIPVCFAADDQYAPMAAACMLSILENSVGDYDYEFYILATKLSENVRGALAATIAPFDNARLSIVNPFDFIDENDKLANDVVTKYNLHNIPYYYRIFIPYMLQNKYEKVLYLDADIICIGNIAELYEMDMDGMPIAAALDVGMIPSLMRNEQFQFMNRTIYWQDYVSDELKLDNGFMNYFNSGVLLFNPKAFVNQGYYRTMFEILRNHGTFLFPDQDLLNATCCERYKKIPLCWNANRILDGEFDLLPDYIAGDYAAGQDVPKILHFAGKDRPWITPGASKYSAIWWKYVRKTPFYENIIYKYIAEASKALIDSDKNKKKYKKYRLLAALLPIKKFRKKREKYKQIIKPCL
jgi:lipopolysaccharide biosynthesis glycosyltransferase